MGTERDDVEKEGVFAEDDLDNKDTEQLLADGELVGTWSDNEGDDDGDLLAGDESVGPWSEDDLEFGLRADADQTEYMAGEAASEDAEADDSDADKPLSDMPDSRARR